MIQLTVNIPDDYGQKATHLIAFLKTLDYVSSLSSNEIENDFTLSNEQIQKLENARNAPKSDLISLDTFKDKIHKKYGF